MSIPGRPVVIVPGTRPPPPVPPDVAEIIRVLNGAAPKVCPACGHLWRSDAPCVCLEPEPVVSWWARLWRALSAPWAAPKPLVLYDAELPRHKPPTTGRLWPTIAADQSVSGRIAVKVKDP